MKRIGIFGATGFIGAAVADVLRTRGDEVVGFSRRERGEGWRSSGGELDLSGLDVVINLAGESVAQRWTEERKRRIRESRIGLTEKIVEGMARLPENERPQVLLNGSAIGYYGPGGEEELSEEHGPGDDFLATICRDWEEAAMGAKMSGVRVVLLRTSFVIGNGGEAWEKMEKVFRFGLGGRLGDGKQWMPWIHLEDEVQTIIALMDRAEASGPVNLVAPEPVRNLEWTRALADQLNRPAVFPVPAFGLKLVMGGFGEHLLASAKVVPTRLLAMGYQFRFRDLSSALADLTRG